MSRVEVGLESLEKLDPTIVEGFNQALHRAAADCIDHPGIQAARKVTLEIEIIPIMGQHGCDKVTATAIVKHKLPQRKSIDYSFGVNMNGGMWFNQHSPTNVDQTTFFDQEKEGAE